LKQRQSSVENRPAGNSKDPNDEPKGSFGTQIVNYKPTFAENCDSSDDIKSKNIMSQGKRTF